MMRKTAVEFAPAATIGTGKVRPSATLRLRVTRFGVAMLALILAAVGPAAGMPVVALASAGEPEVDDAWLWADPDDLFFLGEDDLFGGGGLWTEGEQTQSGSLDDALFIGQGVDVGGAFNLSAGARWIWSPETGDLTDGISKRSLDLTGSLFFDYRPSLDFRGFAKLKGDVGLTDSPVEPNVKLHELFADFTVGERMFVRAGKQTVNWGVGYFFSPADIINIGRIDPEEPEAELEGPVAVRLNVPAGRNNYYAYAIIDGKPGDYRVALAPKLEFVYGGSEVGLGLYYRADRAPRVMATLSTSLFGRVAVFSEAVVSKGSDKRFVKEEPTSPLLGLEVYEDPDTVRFHLTTGARVTHSDPDGRFTLMTAGQYFYNGEGYDGEFLKENLAKMGVLASDGQLAVPDITQPGRHYAAFSMSGTSNAFRNLAPSAFWIGNLSDGSGMVSFSLGYTAWKDVRPSISIRHMYGEPGSELAPGGPMNEVTVGISFGKSW